MKLKIGFLLVSLLALCNLSMLPMDWDGITIESYQKEVLYFSKIVNLQGRGEAEINRIVSWVGRYNSRMPDSLKQVIANEIWLVSLRYDNLPVDLICGTITWESAKTWNPSIVSPVGAIGLMQIMPGTGSFLSKWEGLEDFAITDLFNPVINIRLGSRYLSYLIDLHKSVEKALANYNGGPYQANYFVSGDIRLCEETARYVPSVLMMAEKFGK